MKVYELAKELNIDNKTLIEFLTKEGYEVKSHMNQAPEAGVKKAKEHFGKKPQTSGGIKAVALPESIMKKVEAEAKAKEQKAAEMEAAKAAEKPAAAAEETTKKKKKIVAVLNPQYSASLKEKAASQKEGSKEAKPAQKTAARKPYIPARDRKPDDYVEPVKEEVKEVAQTKVEEAAAEAETRAAEVKAVEAKAEEVPAANAAAEVKSEKASAAETGADSEVKAAPQVKTEETPVVEAKTASEDKTEKAHAAETAVGGEAKNAVGAKAEEAPAAEVKSEKAPAEIKAQAGQKTSKPAAENRSENQKKAADKKSEAKARAQAQIKAETSRPGESEAIKSLRAKIVKGTINPDDLLSSTSRPQKKNNDRNNNNNNNNNRNNAGAGRGNNNNRNNGNNAGGNNNFNRNNRNGNNNGYNKDADKDSDNNSRQFTSKKTSQNSSSQGAAAPADAKGRGKGKQAAKGKYDKNSKGDKFDRLENERGAQRTNKQVVKPQPEEEEIKVISVPDTIELKEFAAKLKMQPAALIKELFLKGKIFTVNDILDYETAEEIALEKDIICEHEVEIDYIEELLKEEEDPEETLVKRPPVVCIMGHVDHGKTSLLDAIRKTNVTAREAGGITQHIGAYTVKINDESITFLDTPGHEAFTAMRLRGAQSTDVAILVVAADDGVKPQTIEAINHAKAAGIHVIVAVNKIDKPTANVDKVKQELSELGLVPEDWGGDTIFAPVSAKTGEGIENLLEMVILDTEILELRANPDRKARGVVIEAKLDKGRGSVATLLVQKGTLKVGDHIAIGEAYGKVRAMTNDKGQKVKTALPSTPVEITGLSGVPNAGETFVAFDNDKDAKQFAQVYVAENKKKLLAGAKSHVSLDDMFDQMKAGDLKELNIIVKADVQGSVEAIKESLEKLSNDEIVVKCIHTGAGNVSISDATLASASNAIIIAFNVSANPDARDLIEHENVDMRTYNVIYNAIDDVELAMKGMYEPVYEEVITGHVEVRQTFKASGVGVIAGAYVLDGIVKRNSKVRLSRGEEQLFDGAIASLKRFNDDVKEVKAGFECGIVLKDFQDIKEGDIMEVYEMKEVPRQ